VLPLENHGWEIRNSDDTPVFDHDGLVKRSFDADGLGTLGEPRTKAQMVQWTKDGEGSEQGPASEQEIDVEVLDVYRGTASVLVRSREYHEHLHLMRTSSGWKIVNAFWVYTT
jgi:Putative lumazine-binding